MKYLVSIAVFATLAGPALADPPDYLKQAIRQLRDGSDDEKTRALRAIKDLGPQGAPAVSALMEALKEGPPGHRAGVAKALAAFGPAAKEAIPVLVSVVQEPRVDITLFREALNAVAALGDPANRDVVKFCLFHESHGRAGKYVVSGDPAYLIRHRAASVPVVAELLADPDRTIQHRAAITMAQLVAPPTAKGPPSDPLPKDVRDRAIVALRSAMDDPNLTIRGWAAAALLDLDPAELPRAVPVLLTVARKRDSHGSQLAPLVRAATPAARILVEYLDDTDPNGRQAVIGCLSQMDDASLPALADGLRHPTPLVRVGVLNTVQTCGKTGKLRPAVVARLRDPEPRVRLAAANALAALDVKQANVAVEVLTELAFDPNPSTRVEALLTLRQLGPSARPAVPAMLRRVRSGDLDTRLGAAEVLLRADRATWRSYVPVLVAALKSESRADRQRALADLRDTGADARGALPAIKERFTDEDPMNRILAAEAVQRIAPDAVADAVTCLIGVLKEPGGPNRRPFRQWRAAFRALDKIGSPARPAAPVLVDVVRADPDSGLAPDAAVLAVKLDPDNADEVYDYFRVHLSPGNPEADEMWLYVIPQLKKLAKPLLPELVAAAGSKNGSQQEAAHDALIALGADARETLPALRELAKARKDLKRLPEVIAAIEKK